MSTTTFENARVGDRVYDYAQDAWTTIIEIDKVFLTTQIRSRKHAYYLDGSSVHLARLGEQVLFWGKPEVIAPPQPPRMKFIHGIEIPDITFKPNERDTYYYPEPVSPILINKCRYHSTMDGHYFRMTNNLCYPHTLAGKEAAILHAKAMLGIKE